MSVYTEVAQQELQSFLGQYSVGELIEYQGISAGVENTNYFVTTQGGDYVLTLFENISAQDLPFCLGLTAFLAEHGLPCAHPVVRNDGRLFAELNGRPAALVQRLSGRTLQRSQIELAHCQAIGDFLGRMHKVTARFELNRADNRWTQWRKDCAQQLTPCLTLSQSQQLAEELTAQQALDWSLLPCGIIHADLFHDNALFNGHRLAGVIDFYNACSGPLLYDLAILVNDWCIRPDLSLDEQKYQALLLSYQQQRPITDGEREAWPLVLRVAALRFWLSRLVSWHQPKQAALVQHKNPQEFQQILQQHRHQSQVMP